MGDSDDPFDLQRFVDAQDSVIGRVKTELRSGQKRSHWMWYIFPQLQSLGRSRKSKYYGIGSQAEAEAYLAHPVLEPRLRDCTSLVTDISSRSVHDIFGSPDDLKFHSSMTLFEAVATDTEPFQTALDKYYGGERDQNTLAQLAD